MAARSRAWPPLTRQKEPSPRETQRTQRNAEEDLAMGLPCDALRPLRLCGRDGSRRAAMRQQPLRAASTSWIAYPCETRNCRGFVLHAPPRRSLLRGLPGRRASPAAAPVPRGFCRHLQGVRGERSVRGHRRALAARPEGDPAFAPGIGGLLPHRLQRARAQRAVGSDARGSRIVHLWPMQRASSRPRSDTMAPRSSS